MSVIWCSNKSHTTNNITDDVTSTEIKLLCNNNKIYFRDSITERSMSELCKELRTMDENLCSMSKAYSIKEIPIYLFITSDGGELYAVLRAIDCISQLTSSVYTVVDGFVSSAGTLLSIVGKRRFMQPSSYMLIHQLRSSVSGKMNDMEDEVNNLKKLTGYIINLYEKKSNIKEDELLQILESECIWNADECIQKGLVDFIYNPSYLAKSKKRCK